MSYKSSFTLFGLPLVHIASGQVVEGRYRRGIARGWIAIGDVAYGALLAIGGIACGTIALGGCACGLLVVGGVSLGLVSLGGLAIGGYAVGGGAVGVIAVGGCALAWHAAYGGLAVAYNYALGGMAIAANYADGGLALAQHANEGLAKSYMDTSIVKFGTAIIEQARWLLLLVLIPIAGAIWMNVQKRKAS